MVMVGVPPQASILKRASYNLMLFLTIIQANMCMRFMPSFLPDILKAIYYQNMQSLICLTTLQL